MERGALKLRFLLVDSRINLFDCDAVVTLYPAGLPDILCLVDGKVQQGCSRDTCSNFIHEYSTLKVSGVTSF